VPKSVCDVRDSCAPFLQQEDRCDRIRASGTQQSLPANGELTALPGVSRLACVRYIPGAGNT